VLNVVSGDNAMAAHLAAHPGLDKVAFTGSTAVGKAIRKVRRARRRAAPRDAAADT
jgi:aldehyde dehydrogenase (NAD+)